MIGAIVGALALCCCGFYYRHRCCPAIVTQQPAGSRSTQQPASKRSGKQAAQPAPLPRVGTRVQVYSKTKDLWCEGRVVKIVNGEAVEVTYTVSRRDTKERTKTLRIDSDNLAWGAKP